MREKTGKTFGSFDEEVDLVDGQKYLVTQGEPYLRFNDVTQKHEVVMQESVFLFHGSSEKLRECYTNEVIIDYDADDKTIFEFKLKGRTDPDFPVSPK